ncbi:MAG: preprotein translocase subunit YajC [Clostridiales bacterium]|nr:preprotein translocase subunit YajC [Clostridiales bacterium]
MYSIIMIVAMVAIFYFLLIRPENKRKKQANEMRNSLAVGDEITTIGGVVGTICAVKENSIVVETGADRVRMELMKWAVSSKGVQTTEDGKGEPADDKKSKKK